MTTSDRLRKANTAKQQKERMALARAGWVTPSADKLTDDETQQLEGCEEIIENGLNIWYQVGEALLHIRDKKLYRSTHKTFEDYCRERWDMDRRYANRLIGASSVLENLGSIDPKPTSETHVRPLTPLAPEEQKLVWDVVQQTAPRGKVTAEHVKSVVTVLKEVTATGAIDDGTGTSIPVSEATVTHIKAAVTEETYERMARQETHVAEKQAKRLARDVREQARSAIPAVLSGPAWNLVEADFRAHLQTVDENSIDCIITDPPYPREYVPLYGDLAHYAARVLKPGGSLLVMTGQSYLPEILSLMGAHMEYHWMLTYMTPGGQSAQLWQKNVNTFWKPILWYVKGAYSGDWHGDVIKSDRNEKDAHHWQQSISGMNDIVHKFTLPDQLVLDPFCGSGTTGVSCVTQHRRFIGIDTDPIALASASERLSTCLNDQ